MEGARLILINLGIFTVRQNLAPTGFLLYTSTKERPRIEPASLYSAAQCQSHSAPAARAPHPQTTHGAATHSSYDIATRYWLQCSQRLSSSDLPAICLVTEALAAIVFCCFAKTLLLTMSMSTSITCDCVQCTSSAKQRVPLLCPDGTYNLIITIRRMFKVGNGLLLNNWCSVQN